ncbi:xanthine dehydrogenase accessory protein XdhC [Ideonella sp. BN130291]|uniref:xanthine dehydrogenase accessory protein XdhC n=1 Tax=Ideonella sp. BN130291 TaxID=3112940 RepID=UPI002E2559A5|nr:xanthine dehydrogenase accessory protein XdhC [Ideonella sp. BN130291]
MNEATLRRTALAWLAAARPAVVVQVLEAQGSTPREAGARMLVSADAVEGTIGGGHLELQAIADARAALAAGTARQLHEKRYALGPALGQCCGGAVTLRRTPLDGDSLARWPEPLARFHLQLYGAGHVGRAIVRVLAGIDCRVSWIDERDAEFPVRSELPPHIECVCVDKVQAEVAGAPAGAFYLVLTHSHAVDLAIVEAVLRRGDFGFLGLIGSATKRARFEHRLQERGVTEAQLQRLVCPIGLPGITGKEPEVIAVGVVAQLLQWSS